ncbi:MAG: hypothetical protein HQL43_00785 [Alphaproteobacteria bacterium]|nr:hypothetical protein [Alphaproteobacteria bacterium]
MTERTAPEAAEADFLLRAVPDLDRGYLINTYSDYNRFQTSIEAFLEIDHGGERQEMYLSNACRPESISPESIFNGEHYAFRLLGTNQKTYKLSSGSSMCSRNFLKAKPSIGQFFREQTTPTKLVCTRHDVRPLSFDQALDYLTREDLNKHNRLFMAIDWRQDGAAYRLTAPCRYVNFPNPGIDHTGIWRDKPNYPRHELRYIQPISGPVIYGTDRHVDLAFVAIHLTAQGTQRIEFCLKRPMSYFSLRNQQGWRKRWQDFIASSWLGRMFPVHEYHKIIVVEGSCHLFSYDQVER